MRRSPFLGRKTRPPEADKHDLYKSFVRSVELVPCEQDSFTYWQFMPEFWIADLIEVVLPDPFLAENAIGFKEYLMRYVKRFDWVEKLLIGMGKLG